MNILLVYKEDYPWDVRVEKIALSLISRGHDVTIVARNRQCSKTTETVNGIEIVRLPALFKPDGLLNKLLNLPVWFNPFWIWTLRSALRGKPGALIIVRDLPLVKTALLVARGERAKIMLDMAEVYPYMYESGRQFSKGTNLESMIKSPALAARYEAKVLPKIDHTLVMIEESRDRLLQMGLSPQRVSIVSNTPPLDKFSGNTHQHQGRKLRLVYVGFLTKLRGLDLLIEAAYEYVKLGNEPSSLKIDIVGKGAEREHLIALVRDLKLEESVTIHGWLDHQRVDELMAQANVGALTYRVCPHWNHTIPNKIFDYMLAGLPVLATEVTPINRIINETKSGLVCRDLDIRDIAEKLQTLRCPELRSTLGNNGVNAVRAKYNWANDEQRLHAAVNSIAP
ncbi:glycosyltransferase family 4 protein [Marinobacter nauticus]|uniref:glycosyltransferase family 4 protein n=1 Tax=Marinobacter nauticus TaxID=2743 RepID=UPI000EADFB30|nr:glycosyltransferase family 4 protein [Marinobacter nauticus]MBW3196526.1 glycosyltransferase family 4 protein [Marinobacter nauticus]MBY6181936.1 glycosyltransferase family 4 protein [Marinobacter nauticus]RKR79125.1 glycosyltransferase involved in cell wall biosynthesis [Marinobacter nauticus]